MSIFAMALLIYMCLGAFAGLLAGLFGVGGGIILVPGFYYTLLWLYPEASHVMQISIATALATILVTGSSSVRAHAVRHNIRRDILLKLAPGIVLGSLLASIIADLLPSASLKSFFAFMIMGLAALMALGPDRLKGTAEFPGKIVSALSGAVIGCLSGLMGIGGATLTVPYMSFFKTDMRQAVGTASAIGLCIAVPSAIGFVLTGWSEQTGVPHTLGYIYLPAWFAVVCCSSVTAVYGARLAHHLDSKKLKKIFAGFMIILALSMMGDELF